MPMEDMFWGDYFGCFTDQFGIRWISTILKNNRGMIPESIVINTEIAAPAEIVWEFWNNEKAVQGWNYTSDD